MNIALDSKVVLNNIDKNYYIRVSFTNTASIDESETAHNMKITNHTLHANQRNGWIVRIDNLYGQTQQETALDADYQTIPLHHLPNGASMVSLIGKKSSANHQIHSIGIHPICEQLRRITSYNATNQLKKNVCQQ